MVGPDGVLNEGRGLLEEGRGYSTGVGGSCSAHNPRPVHPHPRAVAAQAEAQAGSRMPIRPQWASVGLSLATPQTRRRS
ncbi:hypothetical protein CYJ23_07325 [Actinomyces oris]|nr:hypothetical protein CYJ23_07325 [Actinomyces oris]